MKANEAALGEMGIAYVREILRWGGPLARALESLDLNSGIATTFLPSEMRDVPTLLQYEPGGISDDDFQQMRQATKEKVTAHVAAAEGRGWAMSEDRLDFGTSARFIQARNEGRETRFRLAKVGESGIFYLSNSIDDSDIEDFIEAATVRSNVSALGVGGPLTSRESDSLEWQEEVLPHLAQHVRVITCEAFDELGLVIWERTV